MTSNGPVGRLLTRLRGAIDVLYREAIKFGVIGALLAIPTAAAIANAVYHATGKRVRDLPITLDKLLRE